MMASGDVLPPSTPTPSTSDISILALQQQQPQVVQDVQEAFKIPDILYTVAFSILWLFGLARNLASYVVSLGIIPLKTATQLFGIKPTTAQTQPHPIRDRKAGSRHTHLSRSEKSSSSDPSSASLHSRRGPQGWTTHTSGKASSSSTDSTHTYSVTSTGSAPGTPRNHHHASLSAETLTDSENTLDSNSHHPRNRNRNRHTAPPAPSSRLVNNLRDTSGSGCVGVSEEEGETGEGGVGDNGGQRTRNRSRVDHSTRRILFVDLRNNRRQTAPPVPYQPPPLVSGVEGQGEKVQITESPSHDTVGLPILRSVDSQTSSARPKSASKTEEPSRTITNEIGEFISATVPTPALLPIPNTSHLISTQFSAECDRDRDVAAASGTESTSERRPRGKERFRSGFKLFGRKRSSSAASTGEATTFTGHEVVRPSSSSSKTGSNKLRRKSPYPGRLDSHMRSSSEAVHRQHVTATVSDAEACSTTWVHSRPKKLTRRCRSNSLNEGMQPPLKPVNDPTPIPASTRPSMDIPIPSSSSPPSSIPLFPRSSTMASTSTSASNSSSNPIPTNPTTTTTTTTTTTSTSSKRSSAGLSFNPLRDLEARLYYRHGVGTGPNTTDVSSYVTTPVPKTGIKRTNPYVLLGVEPPRGSPSSLSLQLTTSRHPPSSSSSSASPRPTSSSRSNSAGAPGSSSVPGSSSGVVPPAPQRRVSAPAGDENLGVGGALKRPNTPSRAHTQPLLH